MHITVFQRRNATIFLIMMVLVLGLLPVLNVAGSLATTMAAVNSPSAVLIYPGIKKVSLAHTSPPTTAFCEKTYHIACYQPSQIQQAYNLAPLFHQGITGKGQTIIIVDSYGSPTIGRDLKTFDDAFGLQAPPSLTVIQPAGPVPPYRPNSNRAGWAGEATLDVEYSHIMAPDANILLVETPTSENEGITGFPAIIKARST